MRILVCGNLSLDIVARAVPQVLSWGTTALADEIGQHLGGNGGSTSYTLGRLGIPVSLISLAGRDAIAAQLLSQLAGAGVECMVEQLDFPTSTSLSLVNENGQRALLYQMGASAGRFPPLTFPPDATHMHLSALYRMPYLREHGGALLASAKAHGLSTSLDAQWDHLGEWPPMPPADLLFVNEAEALALTGLRDEAATALALRDHGAGEVVVKLGERGCFCSTAEGDFYSAAFPANATDTTGAGDVFCGAYLAGLHAGRGHRGAAQLANRIAALAITTAGATAALDSVQLSSW